VATQDLESNVVPHLHTIKIKDFAQTQTSVAVDLNWLDCLLHGPPMVQKFVQIFVEMALQTYCKRRNAAIVQKAIDYRKARQAKRNHL